MGKSVRQRKTLVVKRKRPYDKIALRVAIAAIAIGALWWAGSLLFERPTMENARKQLAAGDTRGAEKTLSAVIESDSGNMEARKRLGILLLDETNGLFNPGKAVELLMPVAQSGDGEAQKLLATILVKGKGSIKNLNRGLPYLKQAADNADAESQFLFGSLFYSGEEVERDLPLAFEYLSRAALNGVKEAAPLVGLMYARGQGVAINNNMALFYLEPYAESNDIEIQRALGDIFYNKGLPSGNARKAFKHYMKAYTLGDEKAGLALGMMYYHGNGVQRDNAQAKRYLQPLADANESAAQGTLAAIYFNEIISRNTPPSSRERTTLQTLAATAAQKNDPTGLAVLGALYYHGIGVRENTAKAREYMERGAALGDPLAHRLLGEMYYRGDGVPRDVGRGIHFFEQAAKKLDPVAIERLSQHHSLEEAEKRHEKEVAEKLQSDEKERKRVAEEAQLFDEKRRREKMQALERARAMWDERVSQVEANETARLTEQTQEENANQPREKN